MKHFIINANLGGDGSLKCLRQLYADGHASKEDYAAALRTYPAAINATKSPERAAAEAFLKKSIDAEREAAHGFEVLCRKD